MSVEQTKRFVVVVDFVIHDEHVERFRPAIIANAAASVNDEPGCTVFDVCVDPANPKHTHLYEVYNTKADFDFHLKTEHFLSFNELTATWVADKRVQTFELVMQA
ncbi:MULTISPECIES: putative quinol monooxygenase [Rhizobium/Agrobacterium group]|uniref:putative quinol monooxygenase n=1 Tax=Rhizobium/Agrobacterium group TaxID=227290 RepID=UPI00107EFCFD|nr:MULTISPECIES: putative quinol monooxygenase [Rhizobium/Agrobacterium group]MBB4402784.1 quinol monooxygenase YgiN [Agrobacterium radiobacter]MBB5589305.1 quinol monooxygenase YgiN [Agrobacterium radiobacter]TGE85872.1 antibiotic biosynthesis monooxygenase [Rhizobium sp. SEMIA 4032]